MKRRVTSRDVAKLAGVSRTTVSFVLNDVPGVRISTQTQHRVLEAADKLNYHPNASARRLVTGLTRILAYVERQDPKRAFSDAILPQVLRGVHDAASGAHFEVLFAPVPFESGADRCEGLLRGGHVDGIILSGPRSDDVGLLRIIESGAPMVLQGEWPETEVASVDVNNVKAARMATEHLIQLGHTNLGMIVHTSLAYTAAEARLRGFQMAARANSLTAQASCFEIANFTPSSGERAMEALLSRSPRPTAVFVGSDTVAVGAMHAAQRAGIRIPDDLAITSFDDIPMAVYTDPPLTTIHLPAYGIGWGAADLLIRLMRDDSPQETKILLDTELVIRESCGTKGNHHLGRQKQPESV